ncbi:Putative cytochrome P450 123 [Sinobacterium norvegicum]|uniref:Cytochrome P450 123 n=1 Tax=Sinobacterium norvegicum TaxID=1641715 RepID=A0ABN8EHY2_9GAMM|nr:cytochrome P450 [Sinobacterium norvegicum]CAH0990957.1 Putative cytochrome P450 123 [Sinobacterium norvegicum]
MSELTLPKQALFNPYDWSFHENPFPVYEQLREHYPVYYNEELNFYALSRYDDVVQAFKNWPVYSNSAGVALENVSDDVSKVFSILGMDPPRQQAVRGIVRKVFTPRRIIELEPVLQRLCQEYIADFADNGEVDFIEQFAGKIPMDVISEMIGVPKQDRDRVRNWANNLIERVDGSPDIPDIAIEASIGLLGYFGAMVAERRQAGTSDDLTAQMLAAQLDGERLSDEEVVSFLFLMSVAGNETTTKLLANALYWGQKHPEQFAKVQEDHANIPRWIEETTRYDNSSQILYRITMEEVTLHGVTIPKGVKVALLVGAANRDPRRFEQPDIYDIDRDLSQNVAFGKGVHFCLGAALARLEGRVCMEELFKVYKGFQVDEASLVRVHSGNVRGFSQMQVRFDRK